MLQSISKRNRLLVHQHIVLAVLICFATSCNNHKPPVRKVSLDSVLINNRNLSIADSLQLARDIDSADLISVFKNKTNIWLTRTLDNKQMKWDNFHLDDFWRDDSLKESAFTPAKNFYTDYAMYLKWSPDSAYIFDMGSYGVTVSKDKAGNTSIESGDIDNEVSLVDTKANTKTKLLFFGPSISPVNAHWADSSKVALIGLSDTSLNHNHIDTILWLINVKEKFFSKYIYRR